MSVPKRWVSLSALQAKIARLMQRDGLSEKLNSTERAVNLHTVSGVPTPATYYSELPDPPIDAPTLDEEVRAWLHMRGLQVTWRQSGQLWTIHKELHERFIGYLVMVPSYSDTATWRAAMDAYDCSQRINEYAQAQYAEHDKAYTISSP